MKPEEKARIKIDQMFADAGWAVVDRDHYAPNMTAVAIKEGLLKGNLEADYFLFINGKAVGILEAKREEVDVSCDLVCQQAAQYARSVPNCYQAYMKPLPLIYQSNGNVVLFKDYRDPDSNYTELSRIHTPWEIVKMLGITDFYAGLPVLQKKGLRDCQYEAITELEKSFRSGQNRALIVLATGAGKAGNPCVCNPTAYTSGIPLFKPIVSKKTTILWPETGLRIPKTPVTGGFFLKNSLSVKPA